MTSANGTQVIAIEEHYLDPAVMEKTGGQAGGGPYLQERLADLTGVRIKEMDEAGIDIQVLSHCPPGAQVFGPDDAVEAARGINDRLDETVRGHPDRFAAFATMPLQDPVGAADELQRCVEELGFKGAMVHGLTQGLFIDDERFWPVFERAQALDVPIYVHPGPPHPGVVELYYKDYADKYPAILSAGWGFTVETATTGLRLVLSGVFNKYPDLKILIGHLGEGLPFLVWRINHAFSRFTSPGIDPVPFRDLFCKHFWITTSGNFSDPALLCCVQEMGVDRILFSVDWPYVENAPGTDWMETVPLSNEDRVKILNGNARKLLKM